MQKKSFRCSLLIAILVLGVSIGAMAQGPKEAKLQGSIDAAGPWRVRGDWTLHVKDSGKADFSTALNMQRSDYFLIQNGTADTPAGLGYHTHHITMVDADVTSIPGGFQVVGTAIITASGNPAPVSPSPLTIKVTGGMSVEFSNISLTFGMPGSNHFGTDPLNGVVRNVRQHNEHGDHDRR
jgi:hypothetical protein